MSALARLGRNASIYILASVLQKGTAFLLLPLYTRFMPPAQYGIYSVVLALTQFLAVIFPLQLDAAVLRFYYHYREEPEKLREFWGTILTFLILSTIIMSSLLLTLGQPLLHAVMGDVPVWPYVVIGVITAVFQPLFMIMLNVLQAREQSFRYAIVSFLYFLSTTLATIGLVVWAGFGALGPLLASACGMFVFAIISLIVLAPDYRICIRWQYLREALGYSIPTLPHAMAGIVLGATDRIVLNLLKGAAVTGVYNIGAVLGSAINIFASGANQAYVPIGMSIRTGQNAEDIEHLHQLGLSVIAILCLIAAGVSIFSLEIVHFFAAPAFVAARYVVPFTAFSAAATGIYYMFVNVLFFDRHWVRYVALGTGSAASANVALNFALVPHMGMMGSATASLMAQLVSTVLIGYIGRKIDPVKWRYGAIASVFFFTLLLSFAIVWFAVGLSIGLFIAKGLIFIALIPAIGLLLWGDPMRLFRLVLRLVRDRKLVAG